MLVKGIIKSKIDSSNKYKVRLPLFETAGVNTEYILDATLAIVPGIYSAYLPGDVVYVDFENGDNSKPVIIGSLSLQGLTNNLDKRSYAGLDSLEVAKEVILPENTSVGGIRQDKLAETIRKVDNIDNIITSLSNIQMFSTEENRIGTWLENKPLYRKTIIIDTNIPSGTVFSVNLPFNNIASGITNLWLDLSHTMTFGDIYTLTPYWANDGTDYFNPYINLAEKKIVYRGKTADNVYRIILTVEYIKD